MSVRAFLRMALTQGTILRRSMVFLVVSLIIAAMSMGVFGWLFDLDGQAFNLAVVDRDGTQSSQALTQSFGGLENVDLSQQAFESEMAKLKDGDRGAVLVIPQGTPPPRRQALPRLRFTTTTPIPFVSVT